MKPPPAPTVPNLLFLAGLALLAGHCLGCAAASRAEARGAVLATAEAVKVGDKTCASYALERADLPLARACETAYDVARASLIVAASHVDAWDEGQRERVTCAVVHAVDELGKTAAELRKRGIKVPAIIDDSILLASALGGCP